MEASHGSGRLGATGTFFPEEWMTAAEIAVASGIPEKVISERFGLDGKHISGSDDHVSTMGATAAQRALARAGLEATDVDVVACFGSMGKDYYIWSAAPKIQHLLGAVGAWTLEMSSVSCGAPVAMKVGSDNLRSDPDTTTMVIVRGSVESRFLGYRNERSRFMFDSGDGAAAAVLQSGSAGHELIASKILTDGQFADDVAIYAGGSRNPQAASRKTVAGGEHSFDVRDPVSM
ncbi:MAG: 3-ketoacyl-ACP synthase, partial [Acidimicrobiia bacterium]